MKQSAVEWLIEQMNNIKGSSINMNGRVQFIEKELNNLFNQAKEMEKEQIIDAYYQIGKDHQDMIFAIEKNAEQYYKETFKSE